MKEDTHSGIKRKKERKKGVEEKTWKRKEERKERKTGRERLNNKRKKARWRENKTILGPVSRLL